MEPPSREIRKVYGPRPGTTRAAIRAALVTGERLLTAGLDTGWGIAILAGLISALVLYPFARGFPLTPEASDLRTQAAQAFGPLPKVMESPTNPVTPEKVLLGRILFHETRISADGTVSCARCHPAGLYMADGLRKSIGHDSKLNPRNAPTVLNAAAQISAHWIGNRKDVEDQAKQAVTGPAGFGMPSYEAVEKILKAIKGYTPLFAHAFPKEKEPITIDNFAKALGAYERTLLTPSRFDAYMKGNAGQLTAAEKQGLKTFIETGCTACHNGPYAGGTTYQKFGITAPYQQFTGSKEIDPGRYAVTANEADRSVFKVPTLRNVQMTPPYFHDGSVDHLADAVRIMGKAQLGQTLEQRAVADIVVFLKVLTGDMSEEAVKVPVLPVRE